MAELADVVGQLAAALVRGRLQADVEAIRVAEVYASHPYLKHFAVPRFRLPSVEVDVPLAVEGVAEGPGVGDLALAPKDVKAEVDRALTRQLEAHGVKLSAARRKEVDRVLKGAVEEIDQPQEAASDVFEVVRRARKRLAELARVEPAFAALAEAEFLSGFGRSLGVQLVNRRPVPTGLNVIAETARLREASREAEIVHLRVKLTEDAVEWTVVQVDGEDTDRLVPE